MEHNTTQQETSEKKGIKALLTASAKNKYKLVKQKTKEVQGKVITFVESHVSEETFDKGCKIASKVKEQCNQMVEKGKRWKGTATDGFIEHRSNVKEVDNSSESEVDKCEDSSKGPFDTSLEFQKEFEAPKEADPPKLPLSPSSERKDRGVHEDAEPLSSQLDPLRGLKKGDLFTKRYQLVDAISDYEKRRYALDLDSKENVILIPCPDGGDVHKVDALCKMINETESISKLVFVEVEYGYPPCVIVEKGDQTLAEWMTENDETDCIPILQQIANGLQCLHAAGAVHGDLNPKNIMLFSENKKAKLVVPTLVKEGDEQLMKSNVMYTAPEIMAARDGGDESYAVKKQMDAYALGVIAFELLTGKTLHSPYETAESVEKTISAKIGKLDKMSIEASTRNAVKGLLDVNPSTRFSSQQAANLFSHHLLKPSNSTNDGNKRSLSEADRMERAMIEMKLSGLSISILTEHFTFKSDPSDPFDVREGTPTHSIEDDFMKGQQIFVLRVDGIYRLRITICNEHHCALPIEEVKRVQLATPEGGTVALKTKTKIVNSRQIELLSFLDLSKCESSNLNSPTKPRGKLDAKYHQLEVTITILPLGVDEEVDLKATVYFMVIPNSRTPMTQKYKEHFSENWQSMSQRQRNIARTTATAGKTVAKLAGRLLSSQDHS